MASSASTNSDGGQGPDGSHDGISCSEGAQSGPEMSVAGHRKRSEGLGAPTKTWSTVNEALNQIRGRRRCPPDYPSPPEHRSGTGKPTTAAICNEVNRGRKAVKPVSIRTFSVGRRHVSSKSHRQRTDEKAHRVAIVDRGRQGQHTRFNQSRRLPLSTGQLK